MVCGGLGKASPGPPVRPAGKLTHELVKGTGTTPPFTRAELQDFGQLAKQTGEDVEDIKARNRGQAEFSPLASRFGFDYPDSWVSAGIAQDGDPGDQWVVFTRRPPAKVFAQLKQLGTDTDVMFGAPATAREIRRLSKAVLTSLGTHKGVFSTSRTGSDKYGAFATVSYSLNPAASPTPTEADIARFQDEALAAGAKRFKDGRMPVEVKFTEGPPGARPNPD